MTCYGTLLGVVLIGASRHDSIMLAATLDAIPPARSGERGRPRRGLDKPHADKGYDHRRRCDCHRRGIKARIAPTAAPTAVSAWNGTAG